MVGSGIEGAIEGHCPTPAGSKQRFGLRISGLLSDWLHYVACAILVPDQEVGPATLDAWCLNHWTTKRVLNSTFFPRTESGTGPEELMLSVLLDQSAEV